LVVEKALVACAETRAHFLFCGCGNGDSNHGVGGLIAYDLEVDGFAGGFGLNVLFEVGTFNINFSGELSLFELLRVVGVVDAGHGLIAFAYLQLQVLCVGTIDHEVQVLFGVQFDEVVEA
jgi:hypothetical protein